MQTGADERSARLLDCEVPRSTSCTWEARSRASGSICCWSVRRVAARYPTARLLRVGGRSPAEQEALAARLGITGRTRVLPFLSRETLHAVYRRAALLVITSDREGFGLPVLEAMAAGLPVLARDLPVLREVAGQGRGVRGRHRSARVGRRGRASAR